MNRTIFTTLLLFIACVPLLAQQPTAFFVESISVRHNNRVSPDVIIAESRLRTGHTYSEQDLREANDRINRLPYVLSADFALEKGSERGRYVLVINVNETRVFFFGADLRLFVFREPTDTAVVEANEPLLGTSDENVSLGWRFFVGRRGAVHFGLTGQRDNRNYTLDYTAFAVGYTAYDLFGTRAFATVNLKKPIEEGNSPVSPQFVVGIPLSPEQTLTLNYDQVEINRDTTYLLIAEPYTRVPFRSRNAQRLFKATWSFNTTNNPFVPTKGVILSATPLAVWRDGVFADYGTTFTVPPVVRTFHQRSYGIDVGARRYFELTNRDSWSAGVEGEYARHRWEPLDPRQAKTTSYAIVLGSISHSLWTAERTAKSGDSRVEADVRLRTRKYNSDIVTLYSAPLRQNVGQASISWVRRNAWGIWRLGLGYVW